MSKKNKKIASSTLTLEQLASETKKHLTTWIARVMPMCTVEVNVGFERLTFDFKANSHFLNFEQKTSIRHYVLDEFKKFIMELVPKVGWKKARVATCPRDKSTDHYMWTILKLA